MAGKRLYSQRNGDFRPCNFITYGAIHKGRHPFRGGGVSWLRTFEDMRGEGSKGWGPHHFQKRKRKSQYKVGVFFFKLLWPSQNIWTSSEMNYPYLFLWVSLHFSPFIDNFLIWKKKSFLTFIVLWEGGGGKIWEMVTSFLGGSLNWGRSRTWGREGSKNLEKVVTSFMDGPFLSRVFCIEKKEKKWKKGSN